MKKVIALFACAALVGTAGMALGADYSRLGKDLTPMGAEKAGSADGAIPAWDGGWTKVDPSWKAPNGDRPNPFADDKVLFTITKDNMDQYADKLPEAAKALLQAKPDAFKMNVYPTRRSAAYPQEVYDKTAANAGKCQLVNDGVGITGCTDGGIPFPIPENGTQVMWNNLLRFDAKAAHVKGTNEYLVYGNGTKQKWAFENARVWPWWVDGDAEDDSSQITYKHASTASYPARDAGEGILVLDHMNPAQKPRDAWSYDPGERRVRRAPTLAFDTPDRAITTMDDFYGFNGSLERYDWKLIGKKEMYVPYNNNDLQKSSHDIDAVHKPAFLDSDLIRYELHRVWIVEGTLKAGQRHLYAKRRLYIDEDTWQTKWADKYDGKGELWRLYEGFSVNAPEVPTTAMGMQLHADLKADAYYTIFSTYGEKTSFDFTSPPLPTKYFTASALRKRGR